MFLDSIFLQCSFFFHRFILAMNIVSPTYFFRDFFFRDGIRILYTSAVADHAVRRFRKDERLRSEPGFQYAPILRITADMYINSFD